jgi:hypothetical protein
MSPLRNLRFNNDIYVLDSFICASTPSLSLPSTQAQNNSAKWVSNLYVVHIARGHTTMPQSHTNNPYTSVDVTTSHQLALPMTPFSSSQVPRALCAAVIQLQVATLPIESCNVLFRHMHMVRVRQFQESNRVLPIRNTDVLPRLT